MIYDDIQAVPGRHTPGIGRFFYFCPLDDFDTIAKPTASAAQGDTVKITTDHTFTGTNGFHRFYYEPRESTAKGDPTGQNASKGLLPMIEGFKPGINEATAEILAEHNEFIVLVQDVDCSATTYYQFGTECIGAHIRGGFDFGTATQDSRKGHPFTVEAYQSALFFYSGTVTLSTA